MLFSDTIDLRSLATQRNRLSRTVPFARAQSRQRRAQGEGELDFRRMDWNDNFTEKLEAVVRQAAEGVQAGTTRCRCTQCQGGFNSRDPQVVIRSRGETYAIL